MLTQITPSPTYNNYFITEKSDIVVSKLATISGFKILKYGVVFPAISTDNNDWSPKCFRKKCLNKVTRAPNAKKVKD